MKNWAVYNVTSGGKKGTFSSSPLKKKGRRKPDHRPVCVFCLGVGGGGGGTAIYGLYRYVPL